MYKEYTLLVVHVDDNNLAKDDTTFTSPIFCRRPHAQPPPLPEIIPIPLSTTYKLSVITIPYSQPFHHHRTQFVPTSPPPEHNFKCSNSIITNHLSHPYPSFDVPLPKNLIRLSTLFKPITQKHYSYLTVHPWNVLHPHYICPPDPCIVHLTTQKLLTIIALYN